MHFDQPVTYKKRNARGENFRHTWHVDSLRVVVAPLVVMLPLQKTLYKKSGLKSPHVTGRKSYISSRDNRCRHGLSYIPPTQIIRTSLIQALCINGNKASMEAHKARIWRLIGCSAICEVCGIAASHAGLRRTGSDALLKTNRK